MTRASLSALATSASYAGDADRWATPNRVGPTGAAPASPITPELLRQARAIAWADEHPSLMRVEAPGLRLVSEANSRGHWTKGAGRAHAARAVAFSSLERVTTDRPIGRLIIVMTRIGPKGLDSDNLARSCKSLRDGVADWLERDDGDSSLTWLAQAERGPYAARIEVWRWAP